jgi:hypothetical protein
MNHWHHNGTRCPATLGPHRCDHEAGHTDPHGHAWWDRHGMRITVWSDSDPQPTGQLSLGLGA